MTTAPATPQPTPELPPAAGSRAPLPLRWHLTLVLAVAVASWLLARGTVYYAQDHLRPGGGFVAEYAAHYPLFRFDAFSYRELAEHGYAYNGDPYSSPNIVFAPAFPLFTRLVTALTPLDVMAGGFLVVHLQFLAGCVLIFLAVRQWLGVGAAWFVVLGLCFSAGSFAFHAYYSESTMLFWLALACWAWQRGWLWLTAGAVLVLGASRLTAAPFCAVFAALLLQRGWQVWRRPGGRWTAMAAGGVGAGICLGGVLAYLGGLWFACGNPFVLLPRIQMCSWQHFHQPIRWWELLTLKHLFVYAGAAVRRDGLFLTDIMTTNLIWTALAVVAGIYGVCRFKPPVIRWGFFGYVLLIYYSNAGTIYLNSTHRYFALMLPIYLLAYDGYAFARRRWGPWLAAIPVALLFGADIVYYVVYVAFFTQGYWYYF